MANNSPIEWTDATWNPIVGCSIVSPGCTHCYAMAMAARIEAMGNQPRYAGTTRKVNGNAIWTGKLAQAPESVLLAPLKRKKPTTYFVNSMGDLFHEDCPDEWIDQVFAVMALSPQHTFQVLTKRAARMRDYLAVKVSRLPGTFESASFRVWMQMPRLGTRSTGCMPPSWPLPNVWLGVSTERQQEADERIPLLLQTPAAVRFISAEPLLGPIALHALNLGTPTPSNALRGVRCVPDDSAAGFHNEPTNKLDWVIVGGESGPGARPMHPEWACTIRDWCKATGVPFFFKQWGGWKNGSDFAGDAMCVTTDGRVIEPTPDAMCAADREAPVMKLQPTLMRRVGKKAAGRHLDGVLHDAMPQDDGKGRL